MEESFEKGFGAESYGTEFGAGELSGVFRGGESLDLSCGWGTVSGSRRSDRTLYGIRQTQAQGSLSALR